MFTYKRGDMLTDDVDALVNTVNCVGVMGRGIALQFKKMFPDNFKQYAEACKRGEVVPGKMFVARTGLLASPRFIINFPTKNHWKEKSRIEYIADGLDDLVAVIEKQGILSLAIPPLGCGLGGLDWGKVSILIEEMLHHLGIQIDLFMPTGSPSPALMAKQAKCPAMTLGRAALLLLADRYQMVLLDPFLTLLEIHKMMFFFAGIR